MISIQSRTAALGAGTVPSEAVKSMPRNTRPERPPRIKKPKANNSAPADACRRCITSFVLFGISVWDCSNLSVACTATCSCCPARPIAAIPAETIPVKKNPSGTRTNNDPWFVLLNAPREVRTATAPPALASTRYRTIACQYSAAGRLRASSLSSLSWASAIGGIVARYAAGTTLHSRVAVNL